MLKPTMITMHR